MRLWIEHETRYRYDTPVRHGLQQLRLTPKQRQGQRVDDWSVEVTGGRRELHFLDHHQNMVELISLERHAREIVVCCSGHVEVTGNDGLCGPHSGFLPLWFFLRPTPMTAPGRGLRAIARSLRDFSGDRVALAHRLSAIIRDYIHYEPGQTSADTTAEQALTARIGVCQDHAHAFIAVARLLGYPARYVSGYLMLNDRVAGEATHAWAETHVEGLGWVGFDVSNGHSPDERYVRIATGLDYREAAPVHGLRVGGEGESLTVHVQVQQQ
jgi:transglutaminase-like putative cysteine protease